MNRIRFFIGKVRRLRFAVALFFPLICSVLVCVSTSWPTTECRADEGFATAPLAWPPIGRQQKPWTRWWWFGSVVDAKNLEAELTRLAEAGLGGIELTCLYGAKGFGERYKQYLSPSWIEMFNVTADLAERLDLGIDLPPCSGWVYGGPWVTPSQTLVPAQLETSSLQAGESCEFDLSDRRVVAVMAYSEAGKVIDLASQHTNGSQLRWQAPAGSGQCIC